MRAPVVMAFLVNDDEDLQLKLATETDAIRRLADILEHPAPEQPEHSREAALSCLAAIGTFREECRKAIIETKVVVPLIVQALKEGRPETKLVACQCARVLSRSVKALRTSLIDSGIADPLIKVMEDDVPILRTAACAVLCNLVLDFSPMRKMIIEKNVLSILKDMLDSPDQSIRVNALWALKNLSYQADSDTKVGMIKVFPVSTLLQYQLLAKM